MRKLSALLGCAWLLATLSSVAAADDARMWKILMTTGNKYYNAYRCNTATGQCWHLGGSNQWQPFVEPVAAMPAAAPVAGVGNSPVPLASGGVAPGPVGTYEFAAIEILSDDNWVILRCNTATGQTWMGGDNKWIECTVQP
ncbi:MAG TPA: hypothetical protein VHV77_13375 [Pirellulales bacterium]|nr:hypothetical protein [Pirellulales bacterium]